MAVYARLAALALASSAAVDALNNGLGLRPQMGWNSWYDTGMAVTEANMRAAAQALTSTGLQALGFKYVNADDGMWLTQRAPDGTLQPDPSGFPNGIKPLADWLHSNGFMFGVYTDRGPLTCGGRAGAAGHEAQDAAWYAAQGVDYVKEDSCNAPTDHQTAFAEYRLMRDALGAAGNASGRPIFFSLCGWENWYSPVMHAIGNSARIGPDDINWNGVLSDIDDMAPLWPYAGPGGWNDPCLLLGRTGNGQLSVTDQQGRAQFTMWAVLSAPMLLSQDISNLTAMQLATYSNAEVIAVGQDPMGRQGMRLGGGPLSIGPRGLQELARRHGGKLPDPKKSLSPSAYRRARGQWGANDPPLTMETCGSTSPATLGEPSVGGLRSGAVTSQQWVWNATGTGADYLSNPGTGLCANIDDCGSAVIAYACVTTGGTCCGANCYTGLQWSLQPDGTLRSAAGASQCLTSAGQGEQLTVGQCVPQLGTQQFSYNTATGAITQAGTNLCVTLGGGTRDNRTSTFGRPLADGSWAVAFINAGDNAAAPTCDYATCLSQTGWEPEQLLGVRDLWAQAEVGNITASDGLTPAVLDADGGVALYRLTPIFQVPAV